MRAGASAGQHDATDGLSVEFGHLPGGQLPGHQDAAAARRDRLAAGERGEQLPTHRSNVLGPRALIGIGQLGPLPLHHGKRSQAGGGRVRTAGQPSPDVVEQFLVVEQHQVGIEDLCLLRSAAHGERPVPFDLAANPGHRRRDAPPFRSRVAGLLGTTGRCRVAQSSYRADADAGGGGPRSGRLRGPSPLRRVRRVGHRNVVGRFTVCRCVGRLMVRLVVRLLWRLVEPAFGQREQATDRIARLPAGADNLYAMVAQRTEGGHPGQAAGRYRSGAGGEIAQRQPGIQPAKLTDQPGCRAGMQAMPVAHGEGGHHLSRFIGSRIGRSVRFRRPVRVRRPGQLRGLAQQRIPCLAGDLEPVGPAGSGHRGDHQPLDERPRRQYDTVPQVRIVQ